MWFNKYVYTINWINQLKMIKGICLIKDIF